jgi:hypothetical protein
MHTFQMHIPLYSVVEGENHLFRDHLFSELCIYRVYGCTSLDILQYLGIFHYILRHPPLHFDSGLSCLAAPTGLCCVIRPCMGRLLLPRFSLIDCQASEPGLAASELPQPCVNLLDIAAAPSVRGCSVSTATQRR